MDIKLIEEMMRLNTRIIAAEARLAARVNTLFRMSVQGQDTYEVEISLTSYQKDLRQLRRLRDPILSKIAFDE